MIHRNLYWFCYIESIFYVHFFAIYDIKKSLHMETYSGTVFSGMGKEAHPSSGSVAGD